MQKVNLVVRIPFEQKLELERQAVALGVTPSTLVRQLLTAAAARFQPATLDLVDAAAVSICKTEIPQ